MTAKAEKKSSSIVQGKEFLTDSVEELKKVTTPNRPETVQATLVTLFIMSFIAILLFLMDFLFSKIMGSILI